MLHHMEICEGKKETMPLHFSQVDVLAEITYPLAVSGPIIFFGAKPLLWP